MFHQQGVKVTKKPSEEDALVRVETPRKNRSSGVGTPGEATENILTGQLISSMFTKVFSYSKNKSRAITIKIFPYAVARKLLVILVNLYSVIGTTLVIAL
jgi:hypothetical protein